MTTLLIERESPAPAVLAGGATMVRLGPDGSLAGVPGIPGSDAGSPGGGPLGFGELLELVFAHDRVVVW